MARLLEAAPGFAPQDGLGAGDPESDPAALRARRADAEPSRSTVRRRAALRQGAATPSVVPRFEWPSTACNGRTPASSPALTRRLRAVQTLRRYVNAGAADPRASPTRATTSTAAASAAAAECAADCGVLDLQPMATARSPPPLRRGSRPGASDPPRRLSTSPWHRDGKGLRPQRVGSRLESRDGATRSDAPTARSRARTAPASSARAPRWQARPRATARPTQEYEGRTCQEVLPSPRRQLDRPSSRTLRRDALVGQSHDDGRLIHMAGSTRINKPPIAHRGGSSLPLPQ